MVGGFGMIDGKDIDDDLRGVGDEMWIKTAGE